MAGLSYQDLLGSVITKVFIRVARLLSRLLCRRATTVRGNMSFHIKILIPQSKSSAEVHEFGRIFMQERQF